MIFIMGEHARATEAARQAGLRSWEWKLLNRPMQLMGAHEPHVVVLGGLSWLRAAVLNDLMDMLYDRSATLWTELDLINRKVPR